MLHIGAYKCIMLQCEARMDIVMERIRLSEFANWVGEERDALRTSINRDEAPFNKLRDGEKQRTYDGADLLAWCLFTQMRRIGLSARVAANAIRGSAAVDQFFKAVARGEDISDLHLILWTVRREREGRGSYESTNQTLDTSDVAADIMKQEAQGYGAATQGGDTRLGLVSMVSLPLLPCLHRCHETAAAHGFEMRGSDLIEV